MIGRCSVENELKCEGEYYELPWIMISNLAFRAETLKTDGDDDRLNDRGLLVMSW